MKAPLTPARFRTSVRHYHRCRQTEPESWDSWIGGEAKRKQPFRKPLIALLSLLVVSAVAVGFYYAF